MKGNIKLVLFLTLIGAIGSIAVLPYQLNMLGGSVVGEGIVTPVLVIAGVVQTVIFVFISSLIGVRLQERTGLDEPHFRAWVYKTESPVFSWKWAGMGVFVSFVVALLVIWLDSNVFMPNIDLTGVKEQTQPIWWHGLLAMLYGGVTEEIMLRLFMMTVIVWILAKMSRREGDRIPSAYFWIGIILASVLFGAGHLPATVGVFGELTFIIVLRALILNSVLGIWFGYLYWKKGLEYAMIAHMAADLFLHVIFAF